jgi:hypothetical protein
MVAVGHDDDIAGAGAVFFEAFGWIVFYWLLVTADEQDGAFDLGGVLHADERIRDRSVSRGLGVVYKSQTRSSAPT